MRCSARSGWRNFRQWDGWQVGQPWQEQHFVRFHFGSKTRQSERRYPHEREYREGRKGSDHFGAADCGGSPIPLRLGIGWQRSRSGRVPHDAAYIGGGRLVAFSAWRIAASACLRAGYKFNPAASSQARSNRRHWHARAGFDDRIPDRLCRTGRRRRRCRRRSKRDPRRRSRRSATTMPRRPIPMPRRRSASCFRRPTSS